MKKYLWLFPFIGGLLALIGILTPIAFFYSSFSIWMWGLIYPRMIENSLEFIDDKVILVTGITISIIIVIFSLSLIITSYLYRRGYFDDTKIRKFWIICGIFILTGTIISLISLDFYTYYGNFPHGIWDLFNPGFGAIGPILGSILTIGMGILVSISESEKKSRRQKIIPVSEFAPKITCPFCGSQLSLNASFCSKCGKSIEDN